MLHIFNQVQIILYRKVFSLFYKIIFAFVPNAEVHDLSTSGSIKFKLHSLGKLEIIKARINSGNRINSFGGHRKMIITVLKNGTLKIGNNVGISNSTIICRKSIIVGDNVLIGGNCHIFDTDFHSIDFENRMLKPDPDVKVGSVEIKNGAFIGGGSYILKGVTIGEKSIIAAGSVVTKSVPKHEIWGGNPAKFIKKINRNVL